MVRNPTTVGSSVSWQTNSALAEGGSMSTGMPKSAQLAAHVAHWVGCLLGTAMVLLFVVFAIGQGLPALGAMNANFAAIAVISDCGG